MRRAALLALAVLSGCSILQNPRLGPEADAWGAVRARWTRSADLHDRLQTHALASALYLAPEVRRRRVEQVAAWKAMTGEERSRAMAAEEAEAAKGEEFLVSLFTAEARDNDLVDRRSVWRVALVLDEGELLPTEVRTERIDTLLRDLYPFVGDYDTVYRIRLPRVPGEPLAGRRFVLRIAGSEGRMDFVFGSPQ